MKKEKLKLPDGRYLLLYSSDSAGEKGRANQSQAGVQQPTGDQKERGQARE